MTEVCARGHQLMGLRTYCWVCHDEGQDGTLPEPVEPARPAIDERTEKEIQHAIKKTVHGMGFRTWDTSQPHAAKITPGLPDLFVAGRGVCAWIEVKRADGHLTEAQERFRETVLANGGHHLVARHEAEVVAFLTNIW